MVEDPSEFYSRNVERQDQNYRREDLSERFWELREQFCSSLKGDKVLDAGCGPGMDTDYFAEKGFSPVGIDVAEGAVEYARDNKKGRFKVMDFTDLDFEESSFNGVWCSSAIFFVPEEKMGEALREFKRVLKEDGILYVNFQAGKGTVEREKWGSTVKRYLLTPGQAREKLETAGFQIIESEVDEPEENNDFAAFICRKR